MTLPQTQDRAMRSHEQNDLFHARCRDIAKHLTENGAPTSEEIVKELVKMGLGNTIEIERGGLREIIAMPTHKYKRTDSELTEADHRNGFISMNELISKMEVWAATDLGMVFE